MAICAAYARYSSEDQRPTSIDDQLRRCRETAQKLGLSLNERRIYSDSAVSGLDSKRAGYVALKRAVEDRLFDILIVDELSRLGRDMLESVSFVLSLTKRGVRLLTCDGLDTQDPHWQLPLIVKSFTAEQEVQQLAWLVRRGIDGALERGFQVGAPPYGYRLQHRESGKGCTWEVVPAEADIVREIYALRIQGRSCNQIAEILEERGVLPRGADRRNGSLMWRPAAVHQLIRNTIYRGVFERGGSSFARTQARKSGKPFSPTSYPRPQYRIVDDDTWYAANTQSDVTGASHRSPNGGARRLFSGLVSCGECNLTITIAGDQRCRTMFCPSCYLEHKHKRMGSWLGYTSESACRQALGWALRQLMTADAVDEFRSLLRRAAEDGPMAELKACQDELERVRAQGDKLRRLLMSPELSDDQPLIEALGTAKTRERDLSARLTQLKADSDACDQTALELQLSVDPRELLEPFLAAPPDAAHLNAVLKRLVRRFAYVQRFSRQHVAFEIEFDLGAAVAASVGRPKIARDCLAFRVEVKGSAHRPARWLVNGLRI